MKAIITAIILIASSMMSTIVPAAEKTGQHLPMPPAFSLDIDSSKVLASYPLGVIQKTAAFSHHGKAHETVTLVNGLEGWVYEVHQGGKPQRFQQPNGSNTTTMDIFDHPAAMIYTLVFGESGKVIDVLFHDLQHDTMNSALLVQQKTPAASPADRSGGADEKSK